MALVPRQMRPHFTLRGDQKRKYGPEAAKVAAERLKQNAYLCPLCSYWHLASPQAVARTKSGRRK